MNQIAELRKMASDASMRLIFTFLVDRHDNKPVTVDKILTATRHKVQRPEAVHFCKTLDRLNIGNFVAGRRSFKSRIVFFFSPSSIGKAALGISEALEKINPMAVVTEAATDVVREVAQATAPIPPQSATSAAGEKPNFQVSETPVGMLFVLPKTATLADRDRLVEYIRNMPMSQTA